MVEEATEVVEATAAANHAAATAPAMEAATALVVVAAMAVETATAVVAEDPAMVVLAVAALTVELKAIQMVAHTALLLEVVEDTAVVNHVAATVVGLVEVNAIRRIQCLLVASVKQISKTSNKFSFKTTCSLLESGF
jgi:hypothetical protein